MYSPSTSVGLGLSALDLNHRSQISTSEAPEDQTNTDISSIDLCHASAPRVQQEEFPASSYPYLDGPILDDHCASTPRLQQEEFPAATYPLLDRQAYHYHASTPCLHQEEFPARTYSYLDGQASDPYIDQEPSFVVGPSSLRPRRTHLCHRSYSYDADCEDEDEDEDFSEYEWSHLRSTTTHYLQPIDSSQTIAASPPPMCRTKAILTPIHHDGRFAFEQDDKHMPTTLDTSLYVDGSESKTLRITLWAVRVGQECMDSGDETDEQPREMCRVKARSAVSSDNTTFDRLLLFSMRRGLTE